MAGVRNPYKDDVDFSALAIQDADFSARLKPNGQLDFSDPAAVKQLTKSLLKRDFGLAIDLPDDRLCPPVPNRLNYILWLQRLLDQTSRSFSDGYDTEREVTGLDIGTGASCIYPLLGCVQRRSWRFLATDIDQKNVEYARKNVLLNALKARIRPLQTQPQDALIPLDALGVESIDFTMSNPPFYASVSELTQLAKAKSRPPNSACTGAEVEMVTEGGEVAFVRRIIDQSVALGRRVQWYSSMLGKLSSLEQLIPVLQEHGVRNWAVTEFIQGNKTRRWALAWSWSGLRPTSAVSRGVGALSKAMMPFPPEYTIVLSGEPVDSAQERLGSIMGGLDVRWRFDSASRQGVALADGNVWSRAARRGKGVAMDIDSPDAQIRHSEDSEPALGVKLALLENDKGPVIEVRWVVGLDSVLYESFCGMLRRKMVS